MHLNIYAFLTFFYNGSEFSKLCKALPEGRISISTQSPVNKADSVSSYVHIEAVANDSTTKTI